MVASHEAPSVDLAHPRYIAPVLLARIPGGQLLRARDQMRGEDVALWTLPRTIVVAAALDAFRAFFLSLRRVEHPHLAQVFDMGGTEETFFYTRELLARESMRGTGLAAVHGSAVLDERAVYQWLHGLASALEALHAARLVHGFIIPQHVHVVAKGDRLAGIWLAEAGTRLLVPPRLAAPYRRYLAPEVRAGAESSPASDIYSLGAVLLEMIEGAGRARDGFRAGAVPTAGAAKLAPQCREVILRLTASDPAERPADGRALLALLSDRTCVLPDRRLSVEHLISPLLVGQQQALAAASSLIEAAGAGRAHGGEIVGEAGSGRSRLLSVIAQGPAVDGWVVVRVGAGGGCQLDDLQRALENALGLPAPGDVAGADILHYARVSAEILAALARSRRRLLVLADDAAGLSPDLDAALKHLVTEAGSLPVLVLTTGSAPIGLPDAEIIAIQRLGGRDLKRLLAPLLAEALNPEPLLAALARAANGNPLWVRLLIAAWLESGRLRSTRGRIFFDERADADTPAAIEIAVEDLVARLSPRARDLVEVLAVWGGVLPREFATRILGAPLPVAPVLVAGEDGGDGRAADSALRFASAVFGPIVLRHLSADRRRSWHEAILAALDETTAEPGLRAPHLLATGRLAAAVRDLVTAAERAAARGMLHTALAHYRQALEHALDLPPHAVDRPGIALATARLAARIGELTDSQAALAAASPPEDDPGAPVAQRLEILLLRASLLRERRLTEEAAVAYDAARRLVAEHSELERELERIDIEQARNESCSIHWRAGLARLSPRLAAIEAAGGPPGLLATVLNSMATLRSIGGEGRVAGLCALRAARMARRVGDQLLAARALVNLGHIYQQLGLPRRALRALDRARSILDRCPHEGLRASELNHRGQVLLACGDFAGAETALLHARAIRLRTGSHGRLPAILIGLGRVLRHSGRLGDAESRYEEALAIATEFGLASAHTAHGHLGELLIWQGEWRQAERHLRSALSDPRPELRGLCRRNLATLLRWQGRFTAALSVLAECRSELRSAERRALADLECARVYLALGDPDAAGLSLAEGQAAARSADATLRTEYHLAHGLLDAAAGGDPQAALAAALAAARETADPTFHAQVLIDAIRALLGYPRATAAQIHAYVAELEETARRTDARHVTAELGVLRGDIAARFPQPSTGNALAASFLRQVVEQGRNAEETLLGELVMRLGGSGGALLLAVGLTPEGKLSIAPVEPPAGPLPAVRPYRVAAREFDRRLFRQALVVAGGSVPEAARLLCLPESTFRYRATKLKLLGRAARGASGPASSPPTAPPSS